MTASTTGPLARVFSWAALAFVVAGCTAILVLIYLVNPHLSGEALRGYAVVVFGLANVCFGGLLVRHVPRNAIGWLLITAAVVLTITEVGTFYGAYALRVNRAVPGGVPAAWLSTWSALPAIGIMVTLMVLLFPDGHVPSPRWRILAVITVAYILFFSIGGAMSSLPNHSGAVRIDEVGSIVSDDTLGGDLTGIFTGAPFLGLLIICAFSLVALFRRRRRASAIVRQQLKWFLFACAFILLTGFVPHFASVVIRFPDSVTFVISAFFVGSFVLVPVAAGFAILRYRLYDIDVVISRTLVYGALAVFITAVYVGIVGGIGTLIGSGGRPDLALSILATAVVAGPGPPPPPRPPPGGGPGSFSPPPPPRRDSGSITPVTCTPSVVESIRSRSAPSAAALAALQATTRSLARRVSRSSPISRAKCSSSPALRSP